MPSGIDPPAGTRLPRRQLVLFVVALIVPSLVLVVLSLRMIAQERELGIKRLEDERRQIIAAVRQELVVGLERAKIRAVAGAAGPLDDHVAMVGVVERGRLQLPWDHSPSADRFRTAIEHQPAAAHLSRGERAELWAGQHAAAADAYRLAVGAARDPAQRGYAGLLLARTLAKTRQHGEARTLLRTLAEMPPVITDEHGVPLALYAAQRLLDLYPDGDATRAGANTVDAVVRSVRWIPPAGVHLMLSVAERAAPPDLLAAVRRRVEDVEQGLALQQAASGLLLQFPTDGRAADPVWVPFGAKTWLVGLAGDVEGRSRVVAVRPEPVFASLATVKACRATGSCSVRLARPGDAGELAGPSLPGLRIAYEQREPAAPVVSRPFYIAALVLVLAVTLLGGVVLWYDMRRELRVAELRSQFVSSVSHELKTPLTAIRMFAETLRFGRVRDELTRDEYLDTIVSESERLTRLLNNVLDFSRIEQGRKVYHLAPHQLSDAVGAAVRAMQYPLAQQQLELVVSMDETVPPLPIDPDAVQQAVLNLLTNAMKYSGSGRRIDLRVARDDGHAVVTVADQGAGIPVAEQSRIFEKFYRIQTPENRSIPGTGLGLTLVQHIARGHGGFVRVESVPGAGSRFSIHLPLDAAPPAEIDRGASLQAREADAERPPRRPLAHAPSARAADLKVRATTE